MPDFTTWSFTTGLPVIHSQTSEENPSPRKERFLCLACRLLDISFMTLAMTFFAVVVILFHLLLHLLQSTLLHPFLIVVLHTFLMSSRGHLGPMHRLLWRLSSITTLDLSRRKGFRKSGFERLSRKSREERGAHVMHFACLVLPYSSASLPQFTPSLTSRLLISLFSFFPQAFSLSYHKRRWESWRGVDRLGIQMRSKRDHTRKRLRKSNSCVLFHLKMMVMMTRDKFLKMSTSSTTFLKSHSNMLK